MAITEHNTTIYHPHMPLISSMPSLFLERMLQDVGSSLLSSIAHDLLLKTSSLHHFHNHQHVIAIFSVVFKDSPPMLPILQLQPNNSLISCSNKFPHLLRTPNAIQTAFERLQSLTTYIAVSAGVPQCVHSALVAMFLLFLLVFVRRLSCSSNQEKSFTLC